MPHVSAVFARGPFEPTAKATRPPAENGKADRKKTRTKEKTSATRALSLKKKEEEEEEEDDDDDDADYSPDTKGESRRRHLRGKAAT